MHKVCVYINYRFWHFGVSKLVQIIHVLYYINDGCAKHSPYIHSDS